MHLCFSRFVRILGLSHVYMYVSKIIRLASLWNIFPVFR